MSSSTKLSPLSAADMATIRSVLFLAGYQSGHPPDDKTDFSSAALLLMQKVRSGENSAAVLAQHLNDCFGRSSKEDTLFASVLPRYAMQGMPAILPDQHRLPGRNSGLK
jgi:hypothetical protein